MKRSEKNIGQGKAPVPNPAQAKRIRSSRTTVVLSVSVGAAMVVLVLLMVYTVAMHSAASGTFHSAPPFSLSSLISDTQGDRVRDSYGSYMLPSFIGLVGGEDGQGITNGDDVLREMYTILAPCIAVGLAGEPDRVTEAYWTAVRESMTSVYVRYHSALPVSILQAGAAELCGITWELAAGQGLRCREIFILLPEEGSGDIFLVLQDEEGEIWRYHCLKNGPEEYPVVSDVRSFIESFSNSFYRFTLGGERCKSTEPVFLEGMRVKSIKVSRNSLVAWNNNGSDYLQKILRLLDFNPDKLNAHEEADGTYVVVENHGVCRMGEDSCTYTASAQGGISLQHILGYRESYSLYDGLSAACAIADTIRSMDRHMLGGDADILLTDVFRGGERVHFVFRYFFDNIPVGGKSTGSPAMEVIMEGDRLVYISLDTIAVSFMGSHNTTYLEAGILRGMASDDTIFEDVTLVYPVDYWTDVLFPVWMFTEISQETGGSDAAK